MHAAHSVSLSDSTCLTVSNGSASSGLEFCGETEEYVNGGDERNGGVSTHLERRS